MTSTFPLAGGGPTPQVFTLKKTRVFNSTAHIHNGDTYTASDRTKWRVLMILGENLDFRGGFRIWTRFVAEAL